MIVTRTNQGWDADAKDDAGGSLLAVNASRNDRLATKLPDLGYQVQKQEDTGEGEGKKVKAKAI